MKKCFQLLTFMFIQFLDIPKANKNEHALNYHKS
jgi:hypothetical protein